MQSEDPQLGLLQRQAEELGRLARDLAATIPPQVTGTDGTDWVHVVLGHDGIPTDIRIRDGWRQRLEPERLAQAVLDANSNAMQRAMRTWTGAVDDAGWWRRRADFEANTEEDKSLKGRGVPELPFGQARDAVSLAEEVMLSLRRAQEVQAAHPAPIEGHDDGNHVEIRLGAGLTGCTIESHWAAQRDGVSISAALSTALQRAVARHSRQSSVGTESDARIDDALATLISLTSIPPDQGGYP